jgi:hypothetical protein
MLEDQGILATWALPQVPTIPAELDAERLFDHNLHFLSYEGPLSQGKGGVTRVTAGKYQTVLRNEIVWIVHLYSEMLTGRLELVPQENDISVWRCRFCSDT